MSSIRATRSVTDVGRPPAPPAAGPRLAFFQGWFFLVSGSWPILHMRSFVAVTGPKTDYWLVRTVGALLAVIGGGLLLASRRNPIPPEIVLIGAVVPVALAVVDLVSVALQVISPIYLADAAVELVIAGLWSRVAWQHRHPTDAG